MSPWKAEWEEAVRAVFPVTNHADIVFRFVTYDDIFVDVDISFAEAAIAAGKLLRSAVLGPERGARGFGAAISNKLKWTAGYVVAWLEDEKFKKESRARILEAVDDFGPDIVLAHSLGSLITYNAFTHRDAQTEPRRKALSKIHYVTLGSQLGNPFVVRNLTPGRIVVPPIKNWFHLYNERDDVFTAPIRLWGQDNFLQVETPFDEPGFADHSAPKYLSHANTKDMVWYPIASSPRGRVRTMLGSARAAKRAPRGARKRALLVGINDYPNPADRLEGCVNDVFLMSSVLQERGFEPDNIRVCLNNRATARGISERLEWLLDNPGPKDDLVFFYSGHGAQLSTYGAGDAVDRMDETLVPYDFEWTPETSVTDDQIYGYYSQLPYDTRFLMIFDCCHSGGIHRSGGQRVRGLTPPDDIRHRGLKWENGMWDERVPKDKLNAKFGKSRESDSLYFGQQGKTSRIGRASCLRGMSGTKYDAFKKTAHSPIGPFLPVILEACAEQELSYEYRLGVESYGAFTHCLATELRKSGDLTFRSLIKQTAKRLKSLEYDQHPKILGPAEKLKANVPR